MTQGRDVGKNSPIISVQNVSFGGYQGMVEYSIKPLYWYFWSCGTMGKQLQGRGDNFDPLFFIYVCT